ncbi:MAG TPA: hypothetical protein VHA82_18860 [Ramlibacter sp.]|uniref:hypothetical protein n=1 Tax=Ramlibacter sp. TaxID=1917967 RepID=UPI002D0EE0F7|nr:hypothetical protein [Ramlibacter sp.]HVZ45875.1 hypothetical protein [Ramlibacter sp.]
MRAPLLLTLALASSALAQTPPDAPREKLDPRKNQKIEHIVTEDDATRIDELRVAGQAERITVQPKHSSLPAYEIEPSHMLRDRPGDARDGLSAANGKRVWNVFSF